MTQVIEYIKEVKIVTNFHQDEKEEMLKFIIESSSKYKGARITIEDNYMYNSFNVFITYIELNKNLVEKTLKTIDLNNLNFETKSAFCEVFYYNDLNTSNKRLTNILSKDNNVIKVDIFDSGIVYVDDKEINMKTSGMFAFRVEHRIPKRPRERVITIL